MTFEHRFDPEPRLSRMDRWCRPFVSSIRRTVISTAFVMVVTTVAATLAGRAAQLDPLVFAVFGACYAGALVFSMLRARQHWLGWYAWYDREGRRNLTFADKRAYMDGLYQRDVQ